MTDAVKLKPCPFCGGEPTLHQPRRALGAWISCAQCGLEGPTETGVTDDDAARHWNTRAEPAPAPDAVKIEPVGSVRWPLGGSPEYSGYVSGDGSVTPLYGPDAMDRIKELEANNTAISARFARLNGICSRILWSDYGVPAMANQQTISAMESLSDLLFADAINEMEPLDVARRALSGGVKNAEPIQTKREEREHEKHVHLWTGGLTPIDPD